MSRRWKIVLIVVGVLVLGAGGVVWLGSGQGGAGGHGKGDDEEPVPVTVEPVQKHDVPVYLVAQGTVQALNTVTVYPQVSGVLQKINFHEGQEVRKGDPLVQIDPRPYQASLDQAIAKKQQDQALLETKRMIFQRNAAPEVAPYVPKLTLETYRNDVAQLEATLASDEAEIRKARVQLEYTSILSPIDGVVGIRQIDPGNLVGTQNALVTLTQIHPIYVMFNLPQQNLGTVQEARGTGRPVEVAVLDRLDAHPMAQDGVLDVIDNQIDTSTGTFKLRSRFPNADNRLWPGQFVNVRLLVKTVSGGLVIPSQAVQRGPEGDYVYLAQADGRAKMQPVKVAQEVGNSHVLIAQGLAADERVVTEGQFRLKPGSRIHALKPGEVPNVPMQADLDRAKTKQKH